MIDVRQLNRSHHVRGLRWRVGFVAAVITATLLSACGLFDGNGNDELPEREGLPDLELSSDAFASGHDIPARYTCDGENISPELTWTAPPDDAQSLVLIVDDPDAPRGTFTHWILFNIPADVLSLTEGAGQADQLPEGALEGMNDYNETRYRGPCPPEGEEHDYRFTLFAVDSPLDLSDGADRSEVIKEIRDRLVAAGQTTGTYRRQ
jgi:Raf kinase inhibitor-like YbhB/YbcL family protein